ncbi:uncharacterized protein N7459_002131 [Penicillium hispanicum]|uniref:uncharacterized protein n=1 Tax=Penicillium hispanicum TaxID=1080232 RepID=UPI0025418694|nr:uncharacterized protein N7459_002131 [Penicillium hispanicum]KAJ5591762.1 hypothetical protein N7459_002131 [Penicillium hispanicum]
MSVDQFASLVKLLPDIEHALEQQGVSLPRPVYSESGGQLDTELEDESGQERLGGNASALKQNIDATSDEDEGKE